MRVALLSTCAVSVPPIGYGGTELVIAELAKMLSRLSHEVTVYATGDSSPVGQLRYRFKRPIWPVDDFAELRHAAFAWGDIVAEPGRFDVVHVHQAPSVAFTATCPVPTLLTLHHQRVPSLIDFYRDFPDLTYVAISARQALLAPELGVRHVVHHGLDATRYPAGDAGGGYAAFVGRLAREKGPHVAIDAALAANVPLKIGGQPHVVDREYFNEFVAPRLRAAGARVEWLGEVAHSEKVSLLQGASAVLFPVDWEEPFGLVMIESMLVGTPVIAFDRGSVAEVVEEGVTGFIVNDARAMATRLRQVASFDRARCRARAEERWSSMRMAREYVGIYEEVASRGPRAARAIGHASSE